MRYQTYLRGLIVVLFVLCQSIAAFAERWEYITTDKNNGAYYLDTTTVERPDSNTVIYWAKLVFPEGTPTYIRFSDSNPELRRIKMFRKRKYIRVDEPGYRVQDVAPDTVTEAFFLRLFR